MKLKPILVSLNAPKEFIQWAEEKTINEAWATCEDGDWMLWIYIHYRNKVRDPNRYLVIAHNIRRLAWDTPIPINDEEWNASIGNAVARDAIYARVYWEGKRILAAACRANLPTPQF